MKKEPDTFFERGLRSGILYGVLFSVRYLPYFTLSLKEKILGRFVRIWIP